MKPNKTRAALLLAFLIAIGAGVVGGLLLARMPLLSAASGDQTPASAQFSLSEMLQLDVKQADKMRAIWEEARGKAQTALAEIQSLQKGRDDAFVAILTTDEQRAKYEKITKEYAEKFKVVTARREQAFQVAVNQTRQILSPEQQKRYEAVLSTRLGPGKIPGKEPTSLLSELETRDLPLK